MDFGKMLQDLKLEQKGRRKGWNAVQLGKPVYITMIYSQELEPYFVFNDGEKERIWTPSTHDILADDWEVVE